MKEIKPAALKTAEAAKRLNMSPGKLREMTDSGKIPCKKIGTHRYFIIRDLDNWLDSQPDWSA